MNPPVINNAQTNYSKNNKKSIVTYRDEEEWDNYIKIGKELLGKAFSVIEQDGTDD